MQEERLADPYPWTWEIPVGVLVVVLASVALAAQLGRSIANLMVTGHWYWPDLLNGIRSVPAIVTGDATAGLVPAPVPTAQPWLVILMVVVMTFLAILGLVFAAAAALHKWGTGAVRGVASATETEEVLGVSRLRRSAALIRPDLEDDNLAGHDGYHPHF